MHTVLPTILTALSAVPFSADALSTLFLSAYTTVPVALLLVNGLAGTRVCVAARWLLYGASPAAGPTVTTVTNDQTQIPVLQRPLTTRHIYQCYNGH